MQTLPIYQVIPDILTALQNENRLILQAPPGAGKTTAVPLALLDEEWLGDKQIIMLEPRRLATRSAAARMAELLGERVGERVGYQIRADRHISNQTKVVVVTEGILTRMLQSDPALENVALIIFDEFHERNLHGDLALALSLQSQELLRDDLKIMVMSATLNTTSLLELLEHPPLITSEGRSYPVQNIYLDAKTAHPTTRELPLLVTKTIVRALAENSGSVLVFLPGVKEIKSVESRLNEMINDSSTHVVSLYGDLSKQAQDEAILPTNNGQRKVVLATNIAETSLTIEGITIVVDAGLQRVSTFNSGSGMNTLKTTTISQDSATQRSGRAGRLSAGKCYRLWHEHRPLVKHALPEILTSDLTAMMLELAHWGVDELSELHWLDLATTSSLTHARELLQQLGAIEGTTITPHGKAMLSLGTHPRLAHMILLANQLGLGKKAAIIAALLSEKEIFKGVNRRSVDLAERVTAIEERETSHYIDKGAFHRVLTSAKIFENKLPNVKSSSKTVHNKVGLLLALAYPDRIAKCRSTNNTRYVLSGGKGAKLYEDDPLFSEPYLVVADLDGAQSDAQIYRAVAIEEPTIYTHLSTLINSTKTARWNNASQRVEAREITLLGALVLEEKNTQEISAEDVANALILAIQEQGLNSLNWSKEAISLRHRINFLNYYKEQDSSLSAYIPSLPDFSDEALITTLQTWLQPHLQGITTFKALQKLSTYTLLISQLTWDQQESINTLAPAKLKVPSGSNITLNYEDKTTPVLAVRLQELFGMTETPKLINNSVSLTIELLSPAKRPMQVTKDIKSFWDNTYDEVKKELRGKYKRHYWPDDPYQAVATSKTKKWM